MNKKLLAALKLKAAALGFTKEELEGVVNSMLANNPDLSKEDATDEAINAAVDAVIPFLKMSQSAANRTINDFKKKKEDEDKENQDKEKETQNKGGSEKDEIAKLIADGIKAGLEPFQKKLSDLESGSVAKSRTARLKEALKDSGAYGEKVIKEFETRIHKTIESDDDFESYLDEKVEDSKEFVQQTVNKGLNPFTNIGGGKGGNTTKEPSKEEVERVVNNM